jgi:hypothetical protein
MAYTDSEDYTNAQLLAHVRKAIAAVTLGGQAYTMPGGRSVTHANLKELRETADWLTAAVESETAGESGGGNVIVRFGEPL